MIAFAGMSHLGLVSSIGVASKNFDVLCYDPDSAKVKALQAGNLGIFEPDLDEMLKTNAARVRFTDRLEDLKQADVVYISLDVKTSDSNVSDLGPLRELIGKVSTAIRDDATFVILSQVPPGFTRSLGLKIKPSLLYYQVETLIFGRAVERATKPERYIVGCADPSQPISAPFAKLLASCNCPILPMRYESAELCKISINLYLAASVTVTNTLAEVCENIGAEWSEIAPALRLDRRIGQYAYLGPGLGLSGGNIERDIATILGLAWSHGSDGAVTKAFETNSHYRKDWVLRTLYSEVLSKTPNAKVGIWGLAYKEETKSIKNSPAVTLLEGISGIPVKIYDPQAELPATFKEKNVTQVPKAVDVCADSDVLVLMTPWKEFGQVSLKEVCSQLKGKTVIDPYGLLNSADCRALGLKHLRLGSGKTTMENQAHA